MFFIAILATAFVIFILPFLMHVSLPDFATKIAKKSQKSEEYQRFSLLFLYSYVIII